PLFLSIGYVTCHWCHVMQRESFSDKKTAAWLNQYFIPVKVDRHLHPRLDRFFLQKVKEKLGYAGWPLNLFLSPKGEIIVATVYLPPVGQAGYPSLAMVAEAVHKDWQESPAQAKDLAEIKKMLGWGISKQTYEKLNPIAKHAERKQMVQRWKKRFDAVEGGFFPLPKFPRPEVLRLLLSQAMNHDHEAGAQVLFSLEKMARSGLRDQLGGAFHRYTEDRRWLRPHFEISLSDNAQLLKAYLEGYRYAYQHQKKGYAFLAWVIQDALDNLQQRLQLEHGCFAMGLSADGRDGREGSYYLWHESQLEKLLGLTVAEDFIARFIDPFSDTVDGAYVLAHQGHGQPWLKETIRKKLQTIRERRGKPFREESVVVSANAMMIATLVEAGILLKRADYLKQAERCLKFLDRTDTKPHAWINGKREGSALLSDEVWLLHAFIVFYEATASSV
ncbi:thioredoxin domain-containing protein, partial [Magnetococcales bacterium HHB-1]